MKRILRKTLSVILATLLLLSVFPISIFAKNDDGTSQEILQTIELPLIGEEDKVTFLQGFGTGISLFGLTENIPDYCYAYVGDENIYINREIIIYDSNGNPASEEPTANGLLQIIDDNGNVLASSEAIDSYSWNYDDYNNKYYCVSYEYINGTSSLPAGEYSLQLSAGSEIYSLSSKVIIVNDDCLLITSAYCSEMYDGVDSFDIYLEVKGVKNEKELESLSFQLKDTSSNIIATSTGKYKDINISDSGAWHLYTQMNVNEGVEIKEDEEYSLQISFSGEKTLVDGVGSIIVESSYRFFTITDFIVTNPNTSEVQIALENWDEATEYKFVVKGSSSGITYREWSTEIPEEGIVSTQLFLNGILAPMNSLDANIDIEVYEGEDDWFPTDATFKNPYSYDASDIDSYVDFSPFFVNTTTSSFNFELHYYDIAYVLSSGNIITLCDGAGEIVAKCETTTLKREGNSGTLYGTMVVTQSLSDNANYDVYLNGVLTEGSVIVTSKLRTNYSSFILSYSSNSFWSNLGQYPIKTDAINSSGFGRFIVKNATSAVLTSDVIVGSSAEYNMYKHYEYIFTDEELDALVEGTEYSLIFRDTSGAESILFEDALFITEKTEIDFCNYDHAYIRWSASSAGDSTISAYIYYSDEYSFKNVPVTEFESAVKNITLIHESGSEFKVTGYQTGNWSGSVYDIELLLDNPLIEGEYSAWWNGNEIDDYIRIDSEDDTKAPYIYGNDAADGWIAGSNLPANKEYSGKIYSGYDCLTSTGISLVLESGDTNNTQYLYFNKSSLPSLDTGEYEFRVYMESTLIGSTTLTIYATSNPTVVINDEDNDLNDENDPVMHSKEVSLNFKNMGEYKYFRCAETKEDLSDAEFEEYYGSNHYYSYLFTGDDGARAFYVELSKSGTNTDEDNLSYQFVLWLCTDGDYGLNVDNEYEGIKNVLYGTYSIWAEVEFPAARVWISFYDAEGNFATQQMESVGGQESLFFYKLSFDVDDYFYDYSTYNGAFYYNETQSIKIFVTDLSDNYNEFYEGNLIGEPIERVLVFGNLDQIILPQFANGNVSINKNNYTVYGYATPNSSVTLSEAEREIASTTANNIGRFSCELTSLTDGQHTITVSDNSGSVDAGVVKLMVDTTAPVVKDVSFTFYSNGNALVTWACDDVDVDYYEIYKNSARLGIAEANTRSYNVVASADDGNTFTIKAYDKAGNLGEKTVSTSDEEPPVAPNKTPQIIATTTTTATLTWEAGSDNLGVAGYNVYVDGNKVAEVSGENERQYTVTGLDQGKEYTFTVRTRDHAGLLSEESPSQCAVTVGLVVTPSVNIATGYIVDEYLDKLIPIDFTVSANEIGYNVDLCGARIEYRSSTDDTSAAWGSNDLNFDNTSSNAFVNGAWNIMGANEGYLSLGEYNVRFVAEDIEGAVVVSDVINITLKADDISPEVTKILPDPFTTGAEIVDLSAIATDNANVSRVVFSYTISDGNPIEITEAVNTETTKRYRAEYQWDISSLEDGKYSVFATAYDSRGNASDSLVTTITVDNTPPAEPENFYVGGDKEKITVMWSYSPIASDSDFKCFNVYRSTSPDGEFVRIKQLRTIGYYDTPDEGVLLENVYYYYVTAEDKYGNESQGTDIKFGQLIDDTDSAVIHSYLPANGTTVQKSTALKISATDNYQLEKCVIEYRAENDSEWVLLKEIQNETMTRSHIYTYEWNLIGLATGEYSVRIRVYDVSGNAPAETIISYAIKAYNEPVAPSLDAQASGHKKVLLMWAYDGDIDTLKSYTIYRAVGTGEFEYVTGVSADILSYTDKVSFSGDSQQYKYKVIARDAFGANAESNIISVTAVSSDTEKPVPHIAPDDLAYACVGEEIVFSGASSTDNDSIVSYSWNFGDGESGDGKTVIHTYTSSGDFTVTLTVTDAYNNSASTQQTVSVVDVNEEESLYTKLVLTICDSSDLSPINGAEINVSGESLQDVFTSNESGATTVIVPNGEYTIGVFANGYIVRTISISASGGVSEHTIGLTNGSIMSGTLTAKELTYDDIISVGIDPNAEGNQHVYEFKAELTFVAGLKTYTLPFTLYKNNNGKVIGSEGDGFFNLGGLSGGLGGFSGGLNVGLFPITEQFVLVIYGEARWLKEMYNVELIVLNESQTDSLDNVVATLELPEGLSLADMVGEAQSLEQSLGNVGYRETAIARWYVRGDEAGEYNLTAKVSAVSMPYGENIYQTFTTDKPLKVYAGSALHMTVTANDYAERGQEYPVTFKLENVSDKPIYNLSFGITGIEQFKVLRIGDKTGNFAIEQETFDNQQLIREVPVLNPGDYIEIEISTTIWFNSVAEIGEKAFKTYLNTQGLGALGNFVDVAYYLQGGSITALEGSTTTIPSTVVVNKVDRPNFLISIYDAAKALYKGEESPDTLMDTFVEVLGYDAPVYLQEGAKTLLSLRQGATNYEVQITIANATSDGQNISNEYVSINSGSDFDVVFDNLNNGTIKISENGDFVIKGLKSGETVLDFSVKGEKLNLNFRVPVYVDGEKVETKFDISQDITTGDFTISSDVIKQVINQVREKEGSTFSDNPYLWFASRLKLNLKGTNEGGFESLLTLDEGTLNALLAETLLADVELDTNHVDMIIDRETLEKVRDAKDPEAAVKVLIKELGSDLVVEKWGVDRPTYEFLFYVGEDAAETVSDFGDGEVDVSIPYELKEGEKAEDIIIERVKDDGSTELVPSQYDSAKGLVNFTTDEFSYYRIAVKENENNTSNSGSGGKVNNSSISTDKVTNSDGSTTTTVTNSKTGTTTATTVYPDGSTAVVETKRDGTVTTTTNDGLGNVSEVVEKPDGSISITEKDFEGNTTFTEKSSDGTIKTVSKYTDGTQIDTVADEDGKTTSAIELSNEREGKVTKVEIPVALGSSSGVVSVLLTDKNGISQTVKATYINGKIQVTVESSATIEILNDFMPCSKLALPFKDVKTEEWFYESVSFVWYNSLMTGVSETSFSPSSITNRAMIATILYRIEGCPNVVGTDTFDDVLDNQWYTDAILWANQKDLVVGYGNGKFGPEDPITREQLATIIYRYIVYKGSLVSVKDEGWEIYTDSGEISEYAVEAIKYLTSIGLLNGKTNTTINPKDYSTRAEIATVLQRFVEMY